MFKMQNYNSKFKIIKTLILLVTFHFSLLTFNLTQAEAAGFSLSISPPVTKINIQPGTTQDASITIENKNSESIDLSIRLQALKPSDLSNSLVLIDDDLPIFKNVFILDNSKPVTSLSLAPLEKKQLVLRLDLPKEAIPSDSYFSVIFENKPSVVEKTTSVAIQGGIGTNVILAIGNHKASGEITKFSAPYFIQNGPVSFTAQLTNTSNHFIAAQGVVFITNTFGQTIGKITIPQTTILANSTKKITKPGVVWPEKFLLGKYKATLMLSLSPNGQILTKSTTFIALPVYLLFLIILIAISLTILIKRIKKHIK